MNGFFLNFLTLQNYTHNTVIFPSLISISRLQIIQNIRRHISMVNPKCFVYFLFKIKVVATAGECREKIISNCFRQESIDAVSAFVLQEAVHVGGAPPGRGVGSVHYLLICLCRGQVISRHKHPAQAARLQPPELGYLSLFCTINQLFS